MSRPSKNGKSSGDGTCSGASKAKNKIAAILRDYNAARATDLSVDPHTYFVDSELVIPQRDSESLHLAQVLHEHTGIAVRVTRGAGGYSQGAGAFNKPVWVVETVKVFSSESAPDSVVSESPVSANISTETPRNDPQVEDRRREQIGTARAPISATGK